MTTTFEKNKRADKARRENFFLNQREWFDDEDEDENLPPRKLARETLDIETSPLPRRILLPPPVRRQQRTEMLHHVFDNVILVD